MTPADHLIWSCWDSNRHLSPDERMAIIEGRNRFGRKQSTDFVRVGDHDAGPRQNVERIGV